MHQSPAADSSEAPHFRKMAVAEPFRAFFPLGMMLGIAGVVLWPLFHFGFITTYPLDAHLRLMSYGFLGSFVIGFLFTAGPRLLSCPAPSRSIVHIQLALTLFTATASFFQPAVADACFLSQVLSLLALATYGFYKRQDLPPPGFVLGLAGILGALAGSFCLLLLATGNGGAHSITLSRVLLFQAFPALPIIGIGAFFFPKLTGAPNPQNLPENPHPTKAWLKRAAWAVGTAALFLLSIPVELSGHATAAYAIRAAAIALYILVETPTFRRATSPSSQRLHLILCNLSLLVSFILAAAFPAFKTASLHLFFILGLTGSILLVSTRVIFGHSGNFLLAMRSAKPLLLALSVLAFGALARVFADFAPQFRQFGLVAAAALWLIVAIAWLRFVAPKTGSPDPEDTPCSH